MSETFIVDTFIFIGVGLGIFFICAFILNFLTKGYLVSYLKVKASRGKLILTEVESLTDNYFAVGEHKNKIFKYTTRSGETKQITKVPKNAVKSIMGVFMVKVDEDADFFYLNDGKLPSDKELPDAVATDNLINRIIMAAGLNDPKILAILIISIVILLGVILTAFLTNEAITAAKACQSLTATIR